MSDVNRSRPVTLKDVAALSGVSVPTASRVLNGGGTVSEATRKRVWDAAEALDFRPNSLALSLALGKSFVVGVLAQKATGNFSTPVITGIVGELSRRDVAVLVYDDGEDADCRAQNVRTLQARRVDGVIVVGDGTDVPLPSITDAFTVPVVHAYGVSDDPRDTSFLPDDIQAGEIAMRHLISRGARRIMHVTAMAYSGSVRDRLAGARRVLDEHGMDFAAPVMHGDWTTPWGYHAALDIIERGLDVDAIFCGNDYIAIGISRAFERAGIRIPEDVALIGYDHWTKYSGSPDHLLTSIDPELDRLGSVTVEALLSPDPAARPGGMVRRPVHLVPGMSTGEVAALWDTEFPFPPSP